METKRNFLLKAMMLLTSLLLVLGATNGYAAPFKDLKVGIKGVAGVPNGGWIMVKQNGITLLEGSPSGQSPTDTNPLQIDLAGGDVTVEARISNIPAPAFNHRVVWYVNGYKLQGTAFSVFPDFPGPNINWANAVSTGFSPSIAGTTISNADLVNSLLSNNGRQEVLTITPSQIPYVNDIYVEFVRDIAHQAIITCSSYNGPLGNGSEKDNGGPYSVLIENQGGWRPSSLYEENFNVHTELPFGVYTGGTLKGGFVTGSGAGGFGSPLNLTSSHKWIRFTFTSPKYIERIEVRRRQHGDAVRITKFQVIYKNVNNTAEIVALPAKRLDVRTGSFMNSYNNLLTNPSDRVNPDKNGDMDQVVYLTHPIRRGIKPVEWIEIRILEWKEGNGTNDPVGITPSIATPRGFERVRIIEAQPVGIAGGDVFPWRNINWGVINGRGGSIGVFSGGFIEGSLMSCSQGNNNIIEQRSRSTTLYNPVHSFLTGTPSTYTTLPVTNPVGRLVNSYPIDPQTVPGGCTPNPTTNVAGIGTDIHLNNNVYFVAKPDPGYRVKYFKITGYKGNAFPVFIANRTGRNYIAINPVTHEEIGSHDVTNDVYVEMAKCLGVVGTQGNGWPFIANGLTDRNSHIPWSIDATTPYATEIIGFPADVIGAKTGNGGQFTVEVEYEKEPVLYSTITASGEAHNDGFNNESIGCKYGVTVGPGNWYPGGWSANNQWLDFKFDKGIPGPKRIKAARLYTKLGDKPEKVRFDFYTGNFPNINSSYEKNLNQGGGIPVYNYCQFNRALPSDGVRLTIVESSPPAGSPSPTTGFQRIQLEEVEIPITNITISSAEFGMGDAFIASTSGTLQFFANAYPGNADYNLWPYLPVTWEVINGTGKAAIDPTGRFISLPGGNGEVTVVAKANDGYGIISNPIKVTIMNQVETVTLNGKDEPDYIVVEGGNFNSPLKMSAQVFPAPTDPLYEKVAWSITTEPVCPVCISLTEDKKDEITVNELNASADNLEFYFIALPGCDTDVTIRAQAYNPHSNILAPMPIQGMLPRYAGASSSDFDFDFDAPYSELVIKVRSATNFENPVVSALNLFPVPFNHSIQITGAANSVLRITNIAGVLIHTRQIDSANETLNLGNLAAGMYFFSFEKDGRIKTMKVVKE